MKYSKRLSQLLLTSFLMGSSSLTQAYQEQLNELEKKDMIERLQELREAAENSSRGRFGAALTAYRAAITSDAAAHDLYIKCVEKTRFIDEKKGSQAFRDWKRRHKERTDTPEFRLALRHQLNWLLLSIEACVKPDEISSMGAQALTKVDAIMKDQARLKPQQKVLKANVLSSAYARAYNINGLEAEHWPLNPLAIKDIYEKVVMPSMRNSGSVSSLRGAWKKRIEHERLIKENWTDIPDTRRIGLKKDLVSPEYEKWLVEGYIQLQWEMEKDCFKVGDEVRAGENMLGLLSKHINNKKSLEWAEDFEELMSVEGATEEEGDAVSGAE